MLRLQLQRLARRLLCLLGTNTSSAIAAKSLTNAKGFVTATPHLLGRTWCSELLHSRRLVRLQLSLLLGVHSARFRSRRRPWQRVRRRRGTLGTLGCIL